MSESIRSFQNKTPSIGDRVYIDPQAAVIGDVTLGNDVSIWPMAVLRGDVNHIIIGDACSIQDGSVLHVSHDGPFVPGGMPLILGRGVTVGHKVVLHGCTIGDYCLIGMGTLILDGAKVNNKVIIGAGSLVPPGKVLESGCLYLGNPVKAIRKLTEKELEHLEYSAKHYIKLKNIYL